MQEFGAQIIELKFEEANAFAILLALSVLPLAHGPLLMTSLVGLRLQRRGRRRGAPAACRRCRGADASRSRRCSSRRVAGDAGDVAVAGSQQRRIDLDFKLRLACRAQALEQRFQAMRRSGGDVEDRDGARADPAHFRSAAYRRRSTSRTSRKSRALERSPTLSRGSARPVSIAAICAAKEASAKLRLRWPGPE